MNTVIWIFQIVLAAWFAMPAYLKLTTPTEIMVDKKQLPPDTSPAPIRILGLLEALGIIGIIVPQLLDIVSILTPVTAVCFSIVMAAAFWVHLKKSEYKVLPLIALAFIMSAVVAYYRF